jgi:hypothetical protein
LKAIGIHGAHAGQAKLRQGDTDVTCCDIDELLQPSLATGCNRIEKRSAHKYVIGPERIGFDDVFSAADTRIIKELKIRTDGLADQR